MDVDNPRLDDGLGYLRGRLGGWELTLFQLLLGFDKGTPEDEAQAQAVAEWLQACARHDRAPAGDPTTTVIRDDPEREAMGEYAVRVQGHTVDG